MDVHGKDVLENLCQEEVTINSDFRWLCQLRYYWLVNRISMNIRIRLLRSDAYIDILKILFD